MGDGLLLDQALDLALHGAGKDPHQGLGGEPVLGTLLVVALGHVREHLVGGLVDVVDDLSKVGFEVAVGEGLEIGKGGGGDVTLPLQVALALVDQAPQLGLSLHEGHEGLAELQLVAGDGGLASGQLLAVSAPGGLGHLPHVGGEGDHVVILVDVVHDLHLEESLDSAMFSLSCLMPLPPVLGVPFLSMTLSHSFLASLPPLSLPTRSMTTGNSPLKRGSLAGSIVYLSIFSRSKLTPGTVSTRPSKEALIWNSLKRQAMTQPVVALESPTWSLTMMGVLIELPTKV